MAQKKYTDEKIITDIKYPYNDVFVAIFRLCTKICKP